MKIYTGFEVDTTNYVSSSFDAFVCLHHEDLIQFHLPGSNTKSTYSIMNFAKHLQRMAAKHAIVRDPSTNIVFQPSDLKNLYKVCFAKLFEKFNIIQKIRNNFNLEITNDGEINETFELHELMLTNKKGRRLIKNSNNNNIESMIPVSCTDPEDTIEFKMPGKKIRSTYSIIDFAKYLRSMANKQVIVRDPSTQIEFKPLHLKKLYELCFIKLLEKEIIIQKFLYNFNLDISSDGTIHESDENYFKNYVIHYLNRQRNTNIYINNNNNTQGILQAPQGILQAPQGILQAPQGILQAPQGILQAPQGIPYNHNNTQGILQAPQGIIQAPQGIPYNHNNTQGILQAPQGIPYNNNNNNLHGQQPNNNNNLQRQSTRITGTGGASRKNASKVPMNRK